MRIRVMIAITGKNLLTKRGLSYLCIERKRNILDNKSEKNGADYKLYNGLRKLDKKVA